MTDFSSPFSARSAGAKVSKISEITVSWSLFTSYLRRQRWATVIFVECSGLGPAMTSTAWRSSKKGPSPVLKSLMFLPPLILVRCTLPLLFHKLTQLKRDGSRGGSCLRADSAQRNLAFGTDETKELDAEIISYLCDRVLLAELPSWIKWCRDRIKPAMEYMTTQAVKHDLSYRIACAASLLCPWDVADKNPTSASIEEKLRRFRFFSGDEISSMSKELDAYKTAAASVPTSVDLTSYWQRHATDLTAWSSAFFKGGLIQASSAAFLSLRQHSVATFLLIQLRITWRPS